MTHQELRHTLALNMLLPLLSAHKAHKLLEYYGSAQALFEAGASNWKDAGLTELAIAALENPAWHAVEAAQQWAEMPGNQIILWKDAAYPGLLNEISDPPLVLYCQGDPAVLNRQQLAIVGSRNPTPSGYETAQSFAMQLARTGFVITSGMALGIDAAAHTGAIQAGYATIAVMGTGLDRVYPARHQDLAARIRETGVLISEFPLGTAPIGRNFPMRNRIISGLSRGVLVVEAALRSGSLITARQALEQGREVFSVPGSIHHPNSKGCHALLRQGAKLVESLDDILEELGGILTNRPVSGQNAAFSEPELPDGDDHRVLSAMDMVPVSVDTIVKRSGLTADTVCSMLLTLELRGFVHMSSAGLYCRTLKRSDDEREYSRCSDVSV